MGTCKGETVVLGFDDADVSAPDTRLAAAPWPPGRALRRSAAAARRQQRAWDAGAVNQGHSISRVGCSAAGLKPQGEARRADVPGTPSGSSRGGRDHGQEDLSIVTLICGDGAGRG
jgi:hypothetical protein